MSPSATPATQKWRGVTGVTAAPKPGPRAPPRAICPTPATQNDGRCEVVPRLPREIKVDVTKCHACHAEATRHHVFVWLCVVVCVCVCVGVLVCCCVLLCVVCVCACVLVCCCVLCVCVLVCCGVLLCVVVCVCVVLLCVVLYVIVCMLYVVTEAAGGGGGEGEARDTESKTRTPHKDVGNKHIMDI